MTIINFMFIKWQTQFKAFLGSKMQQKILIIWSRRGRSYPRVFEKTMVVRVARETQT